jgi:N-acetylglucosaminyldiphosphoundecaprenol N-acetyl-beta-D-mannosaminyltransferase
MLAQDDAALMASHAEAAMVAPDGMPLVWLGRRAGHPVERTSGADLMERVLSDSVASGLTHYFLGGKPGVAERLKACFEQRMEGVKIVGAHSPAFGPVSEESMSDMAARVAGANPAVVWIGLSTPKQEFLMREFARRVNATFIGVGAAFDFHTGAVKRAPLWMRRSGLEWLHRLASEPKRLWRRYLVLAPRFVVLAVAEEVQRRIRRMAAS